MKNVSVIINTLNRAPYLANLIRELLNQNYDNFEIIVVKGPCDDYTDEVISYYQSYLKVFHCPKPNLSLSRNIGIDNATGEIVAFIDDDAIPVNQSWIKNGVSSFTDEKIAAVSGPVLHKYTNQYEFYRGYTNSYGFQIFDDRKNEQNDRFFKYNLGVAGGNVFYSKKILKKINGFDVFLKYYLDETDVAMNIYNANYKIIFNEKCGIRHFKAVSNTRKSNTNQKWDIITASDTYFCLKHADDNGIIKIIKTLWYSPQKHFFQENLNFYKAKIISTKQLFSFILKWCTGIIRAFVYYYFSEKENYNFIDQSNKFKKVQKSMTKQEKIVLITNKYSIDNKNRYDIQDFIKKQLIKGNKVILFERRFNDNEVNINLHEKSVLPEDEISIAQYTQDLKVTTDDKRQLNLIIASMLKLDDNINEYQFYLNYA